MGSISASVAPGFSHLALAESGHQGFTAWPSFDAAHSGGHAVCSLISGRRSTVLFQPWRHQLFWLRPQRVSGSLECLTVHSSGRRKASLFGFLAALGAA